MKRRRLFAAALLAPTLGLGACSSILQRPYEERRQWPLMVRRPTVATAPRGAPILVIRGLRAGPGMDVRGLQTLRADGSIQVAFYEEWLAPPAEAAGEALRRWLADSGLYSAVVTTGSRLEGELVLEGELTALWTVPALGQAHAGLGITVASERGAEPRVLTQESITAELPLSGTTPREAVAAQTAALALAFARIEAALRRETGRGRRR